MKKRRYLPVFIIFALVLACGSSSPEELELREWSDGTRAVVIEDEDEDTPILMDYAVYQSLLKTHDYDEIKQWHRDRYADDAEYRANYDRIQSVSRNPALSIVSSVRIEAPRGSYSYGFHRGTGFHGGK